MVVSNTLQNLRLDIQGSTIGAQSGSEAVERVITLQNRGPDVATIELWFEPTDAQASALLQWGLFDKSDVELVLNPDEKIDVTLSFLIPLQAEPGFYSYEICARSPQYPNEEIRRSQQLQVVPSAQEVRLRNEPKVTIDPATDSTHPDALQAGETLTFTVTVENPSRRTDRFFLHCPDLDADWYSVIYPENMAMASGKLSFTDGLELNPGETGAIRCQIHPPQHAPAGQYFPTLRLQSKVRSELCLLRVVYFTLMVNDRLQADLVPNAQTLPDPDLCFRVVLLNQGNIQRSLGLQAWDVERLLEYRFQPAEVTLDPGEEAIARLTAHPRRWWHRIWRLRDRDVDFEVLIENRLLQLKTDSDDTTLQPALPYPLPVGKVLYKAQRRWLFRLLLLSLGLGTTVTLLWVIWEFLVWLPSLKPTIVDFSTPQEAYKEDGEPITFSWEITNAGRIHHLVLSPKDFQSEVVGQTTYRLDDSATDSRLPQETIQPLLELENANCFLADTEPSGWLSPLLGAYRQFVREPESQSLRCRTLELATGTSEENRNPLEQGSYAFELEVFWTRQRHEQTAPPNELSENAQVPRVQQTEQKQAPLTAESPDQEPRLADRTVVQDVVVAPPDPPVIIDFSAAAAEYQVAASRRTPDPSEVNASAETVASAESTAPSAATPPIAEAPVMLNWTIDNPSEIQTIQILSLAPDASANTPTVSFDFTNGAINRDLARYCTGSTEVRLQCANVPTQAEQVGEYTFYLRVIANRDGTPEAIAQPAPMVAIKPLAPIINSFQVNGVDVLAEPRQVFDLNPALETIAIRLSWEVENASKIELSPAPGEIQDDSINYTLSAAPGVETIELRATNEAGEVVTRSVVIEKTEAYVPESPLSLPIFSVPSPSGGASSSGSSAPPSIDGLEPVHTPPQAD